MIPCYPPGSDAVNEKKVLIQGRQIFKSFSERSVLKGLEISLHEGEVLTLLGRSGSGKSSLLRILADLDQPCSGEVWRASSKLSFLMQEDLLLPWRNALDNVLLPAELGSFPKKDPKHAKDLLQELGLEGFEKHFPHELSGGMRQRVALARSLYRHESVLLLDEPFASLDVVTRESLYSLVKKLCKRHGLAVLLITHDFHDAIQLSDRIQILQTGCTSEDLFPPFCTEQIRQILKQAEDSVL